MGGGGIAQYAGSLSRALAMDHPTLVGKIPCGWPFDNRPGTHTYVGLPRSTSSWTRRGIDEAPFAGVHLDLKSRVVTTPEIVSASLHELAAVTVGLH